ECPPLFQSSVCFSCRLRASAGRIITHRQSVLGLSRQITTSAQRVTFFKTLISPLLCTIAQYCGPERPILRLELLRRRLMSKVPAITLSVAMMLGASVQAQTQTQAPADSRSARPAFRTNVVSRTTRAVSYRHRSGATRINFQGADLMPAAMGQAK